MFENSGAKVKGLARAIFWLTIIATVIVILLQTGGEGVGLAVGLLVGIPLSILLGWLSSISLYCIGEIWCMLKGEQEPSKEVISKTNGNSTNDSQYYWTCSKCGKSNLCTLNSCKFCGTKK